ncbi:MAG: SDR family oxidoreductase [Chitinophagaceae bacterium]|nr:SDR family oxidoreductase [Chitinophagaceae bacterium]MCW5905806.1 SDR family oxidoreductase [Chitinophagaceae bacterium]
MNIDKKIAILTGASKGLGSAIATALINKGAVVYGLSRNMDALNELKNILGNSFHPVQLDITNDAAITQWVNNTFSENYIPDILINNAGVGSFHKIDETEADTWLAMINTNLNGMFYITSKVAALMKKKKESSHIINIGSIIGKVGRTEATAYCTTKFGVQGFSESLYIELRPFNIKVTCMNPGSIETDFLKTSGIASHTNMLHTVDLANTLIHILETPDNMLINEITIRPLNPKPPTH